MTGNGFPLVLMEDLTKVFRNGKVDTPVLYGIDLAIQQGEFVTIFGPSGCGKSTLLAIMGLLDSATAGVYCFKNQPVQSLKLADRARMRATAVEQRDVGETAYLNGRERARVRAVAELAILVVSPAPQRAVHLASARV